MPGRRAKSSSRLGLGGTLGTGDQYVSWMLEIGAFFLGTETELLLKSRRVVPAKLLASGFQFKFPALDAALKQIVKTVVSDQ